MQQKRENRQYRCVYEAKHIVNHNKTICTQKQQKTATANPCTLKDYSNSTSAFRYCWSVRMEQPLGDEGGCLQPERNWSCFRASAKTFLFARYLRNERIREVQWNAVALHKITHRDTDSDIVRRYLPTASTIITTILTLNKNDRWNFIARSFADLRKYSSAIVHSTTTVLEWQITRRHSPPTFKWYMRSSASTSILRPFFLHAITDRPVSTVPWNLPLSSCKTQHKAAHSIDQLINQSIKLLYSAPKSWPESWPTQSAALRNN